MVYKLCALLMLGLSACQSNPSAGHSSARRPLPGFEAPNLEKAARLHTQLGMYYLERGEVARAKAKLVHAIKIAPQIPETHAGMAFYLEQVKEFKDAEKEHLKAIRLSTDKGNAYNSYAAFLCRQERYAQADKYFNLALQDKTYARTAEIYSNAGMCALKSNHKEQATAYLISSIEHNPHQPQAWIELAQLALEQQKFQEALQFVTKACEQQAATPQMLLLELQAQLYLQHKAAATALLKQLKQQFPSTAETSRAQQLMSLDP